MAKRPTRRRVRVVSGFVPVATMAERMLTDVELIGPGGAPAPLGPVPSQRFTVLRPQDLVVLEVAGYELDVVDDGSGQALVAKPEATDARLVLSFPMQHLAEEAWPEPEGAPPPPVGDLAAVRAAFPSRIALHVASTDRIELSSQGVLGALGRLPLAVAPPATPRTHRPTGRVRDLRDVVVLPGGMTLGVARTGFTTVLGTGTATVKATSGALITGSQALRSLQRRAATTTLIDGTKDAAGVLGLAVHRHQVRPRIVRLRPPTSTETAIEAPWRLIISPSDRAGFVHETEPVTTAAGHTELWHTRLGVRQTDAGGGTVSVVETADPQRIVRAVWNRDREQVEQDPFLTSLNSGDRRKLVRQSSEVVTTFKHTTQPEPVDVDQLSLSSLGAWLDLHGAWDTDPYLVEAWGNPVERWDHLAPMGRDQFVRVIYPGVLFPFGHRTVLVKITERKIKESVTPVARLYQRFFLIVTEVDRLHDRRDLPFTATRFLTIITPSLDFGDENNAFVPYVGGQPFHFAIRGRDHVERDVRLHAPALWVPMVKVATAADGGAAFDAQYRADPNRLFKVDGFGQHVAIATSTKPGDTTVEMRSLHLKGTLVDGEILPHLLGAEVVVPTAQRLTPSAPAFSISYLPDFVDSGFAMAAEVFAKVVDPTQLLAGVVAAPATLPAISFGSTKSSGGFISPTQQIAGLSRSMGTIGDVTSPGALAGSFPDPDTLFGSLLGDLLPKLFGIFSLTDVLQALGLGDIPAFVSEALGPVQRLLADLEELRQEAQGAVDQAEAAIAAAQAGANAVPTWATAVRDQLEALATTLTGQVQAVLDAVAAVLPPGAPKDLGAVQAALVAMQGSVAHLRAIVTGAPLPPLAKGKLDTLLGAVEPAFADIAAVIGTIDGFIHGLDPDHLEIRATLDWRPKLQPFRLSPGDDPVFTPKVDSLRVAVEARVSAGHDPTLDVLAELRDFSLTLVPPMSLMALHFDRLAFRGGSSRKPEVDVVFRGLEFLGPLSFIETLRDMIPLDGFSDPPFLEVSPSGVRAGFTLALPNVAVGIFALQNISLGADCNVPFLGGTVTVGFNFCTRERPFALTVGFLGGGGFFALRISPKGLEVLELALEFGARLAVDLGIASGSIEAMAGIYLRLEGPGGSLTGYFRLRGEVDVLGLISASIELNLSLTYDFGTGKLKGKATLTIEVEVFLLSFSVSATVERQFAGSNGDPTFAQLMADRPDGSSRWDDYCLAFTGA